MVTLDGPGSALLVLPTLRLVQLTSVVENGVTLNVADLHVSARGLVRKRSGARWSEHYGSIVVTMTHGFPDVIDDDDIDTEDNNAADFNAAVASFVKRNADGRRRVVGPFQYDTDAMDPASAFSVVERSLLDQYRLESAP